MPRIIISFSEWLKYWRTRPPDAIGWDKDRGVLPGATGHRPILSSRERRRQGLSPYFGPAPFGYPVRIGRDQSGQSMFKGEIGRATMFRGALEPDAVRDLATGDREEIVATESTVCCVLAPKPGDTLATKPGDFEGAVSFEAWIRPAKGEAGRIIDKLTAGKGDGFLFDCWPDLSLLAIVGSQQESFANVLQPGVWQHVAVVMSKWEVEMYLNGKQLR